MIKHHLGPLLGVWIMQVSLFSSVLINRFHCITDQKNQVYNTISNKNIYLIRSPDFKFVGIFNHEFNLCTLDISLPD